MLGTGLERCPIRQCQRAHDEGEGVLVEGQVLRERGRVRAQERDRGIVDRRGVHVLVGATGHDSRRDHDVRLVADRGYRGDHSELHQASGGLLADRVDRVDISDGEDVPDTQGVRGVTTETIHVDGHRVGLRG